MVVVAEGDKDILDVFEWKLDVDIEDHKLKINLGALYGKCSNNTVL